LGYLGESEADSMPDLPEGEKEQRHSPQPPSPIVLLSASLFSMAWDKGEGLLTPTILKKRSRTKDHDEEEDDWKKEENRNRGRSSQIDGWPKSASWRKTIRLN
jgi:hypothetical protein